MRSVNKFICVGRLTKDPAVKYTPSGSAVANFSIALNESYKDKAGQKQDRVEYVNIVAWTKLAEIAGEYLKKGSSVYLEGRLTTRSYEKDGQTKYVTEVVANELVMLDSKPSGNGQTEKAAQPEAVGMGEDSPF
jgi:single-strand DNA-binding protein